MEENSFETYVNQIDKTCNKCMNKLPITEFETYILHRENELDQYMTNDTCKACNRKTDQTMRSQEYKKLYRLNHREEHKLYSKNYYQQNKDYWKQYYTCDCGGVYYLSNKSKHLKTMKHKKYIENII